MAFGIGKAEMNIVLINAIEELPERQNLAIHLCYFERMSYTTAGKEMGIAKQCVQRLVLRAHRNLRRIINEEINA